MINRKKSKPHCVTVECAGRWLSLKTPRGGSELFDSTIYACRHTLEPRAPIAKSVDNIRAWLTSSFESGRKNDEGRVKSGAKSVGDESDRELPVTLISGFRFVSGARYVSRILIRRKKN